jgi:hypothetical protein
MMEGTIKRESRLYTMKLHESIRLGAQKTVLRVPGGWIYYDYIKAPGEKECFLTSSVVFVPFDNEFKVNHGFIGRKMSSG